MQGHAVTLTFKVETQILCATHPRTMVIISVKQCGNPTSKNKVMGRTRFCFKVMCDLDFQGRDPNVARDTSSHYGDHFCATIWRSDFK